MSRIKKEIRQNMSDWQITEDGTLTAGFVFPEEFIGFQGHFPAQKVLPAFCQVQCILAMLEKWKKERVRLEEIILAKFLSPVLPMDKINCVCKFLEENEKLIIAASIHRQDQRVAELKLKVTA